MTWNSRAVIDACRPLDMLKDFPPVGKASDELRSKVRQKFKDQLKKRSSGPGRGNRAQRPSCDPVPAGARARFRGLKDSRLAHNYAFLAESGATAGAIGPGLEGPLPRPHFPFRKTTQLKEAPLC